MIEASSLEGYASNAVSSPRREARRKGNGGGSFVPRFISAMYVIAQGQKARVLSLTTSLEQSRKIMLFENNHVGMGIPGHPVVLVHGWKSHPGIWKRFIPLLNDTSLPVWSFGYDWLKKPSLADLAAALGQFIRERQDETGYNGAIDIVGHSMGTCVSRYMLEVLDREAHNLGVRQLIGVGPPNNGFLHR
jgi:pimeloyl-ACP methyl ester carboxylesterase